MDFPKGTIDLIVLRLGEEGDNTFSVVIGEARAGQSVDTEVGEVRPLLVTPEARVWRIEWNTYVAYAVRDESYATLEEGESWNDDRLRQRSDSLFLHYVRSSTLASDDYPGPLQCWAITSLNHCIEVVSIEAPTVALLDQADLQDLGVSRSPAHVSNFVRQ